MNARNLNEFDMLKRVNRFILENPIVPANAQITALGGNIIATIAAFEAAATAQANGRGGVVGGVRTKRSKGKELREYLKDVARVGRALDPETHPGLAARFVLPRNRAYATVTASARSIIEAATEVEAEMIADGLPATFLADLNTLLEEFEDAVDAKIDSLQTQVGGTFGVRVRAAQGMKAAKKLDAIFRAIFRTDPVKLGVWKHARHVERDLPGETEIPTDPGSGGGSGTGAGSSEGSGITA